MKRLFILTALVFILCGLVIAQPHHIVKAEADTYISGKNNGNHVHGHPDSVSAGDNYTLLVIKNEGEPLAGNSFYRETYLRFDLSSIDKPIEKVELKLWSAAKADTIDWEAYEDTLTFGSYLIEDDNWDEETMSWNMAPIPNFDKALEIEPAMWYEGQEGEENGMGYHYYGWNEAGLMDASIFESERLGDGKISMNFYGREKKVIGETEKTWFAVVSKDSAAMVGRDFEPRLHIWVEGGTPSHVENNSQTPQHFSLGANYPNPFNPSTTIHYSLAKDSATRLTIYNAIGQPVRILKNLSSTPGSHTIKWDGRIESGEKAPSGVYFYKLQSAENQAVRKMILMQ